MLVYQLVRKQVEDNVVVVVADYYGTGPEIIKLCFRWFGGIAPSSPLCI